MQTAALYVFTVQRQAFVVGFPAWRVVSGLHAFGRQIVTGCAGILCAGRQQIAFFFIFAGVLFDLLRHCNPAVKKQFCTGILAISGSLQNRPASFIHFAVIAAAYERQINLQIPDVIALERFEHNGLLIRTDKACPDFRKTKLSVHLCSSSKRLSTKSASFIRNVPIVPANTQGNGSVVKRVK